MMSCSIHLLSHTLTIMFASTSLLQTWITIAHLAVTQYCGKQTDK